MSEFSTHESDAGWGPDMASAQGEPKFVIAIDYGTTHTGVAWVLTTGRTPTLNDVTTVMNWPGAVKPKVPSEYTYSANTGQRNWGHGIPANALVIRWTKLDLEAPDLKKALENLEQTASEAKQLNFNSPTANVRSRQIPRHLIRTSEDIMTAYLEQVLRVTRRDIETKKDPHALTLYPVDLVITHPAVWDTRGKNSTFRAVTNAFKAAFGDISYKMDRIRLATEPEACAQYLAQESGIHASGLRQGTCVIVVDAGGGTVDLASYRVEQVTPSLRLKRITKVSGDKFGATMVDDFLLQKVLPNRLKPQDYKRLLNMGRAGEEHSRGSHVVLRQGEQIMLERFMPIKHGFTGRSGLEDDEPMDDQRLELPQALGIEDSPRHNIRGGALILTHDDMVAMFERPIIGAIDLIDKQITQIDRQNLTPAAILLSGGFSTNKHYQQCIRNHAHSNNMTLLPGEDSWTAVAKGAVLMGLGLGCEVPPSGIACPIHIGVVVSAPFKTYEHSDRQRYRDSFSQAERARDHVLWVVKQNDLIMEKEEIKSSVRIVRSFNTGGNASGRVTIVAATWPRPGDPDYEALKAKKLGNYNTYDLTYNLDNLIDGSFVKEMKIKRTKQSYKQVEMSVEISVSQSRVSAQLIASRPTSGSGAGVPSEVSALSNLTISLSNSYSRRGASTAIGSS